MEVRVSAQRVVVRATVSAEEVLIAANGLPASEAVRQHGQYLLGRVRVIADGRQLTGHVVEAPDRLADRPSYALEYAVDRMPEVIVLEQDVLREFEFAPGNRWDASYLVRMEVAGRPPAEGVVLLTSGRPLRLDCGATPSAATSTRTFAAFLRHGVVHVLSGYDHLLFVTALLLGAAGARDVLKVITAFTAAHTITLVLAVLDLVRLPHAVVEPMIAGSIVVAAAQNVLWPHAAGGPGRTATAFGFGLFHGLGFAGGLLDAMAGMRAGGAVLSVAAFSLGVESGHAAVVLPGLAMLRLARRGHAAPWRSSASHGGSGPGGTPPGRFERSLRRCVSTVISLAGIVYFAAAVRH